MIRQTIALGEHTYICDLYKAKQDLGNSIQRKFVMLRKYNVTSDIGYDTDIYFIEKSILDEVIKDLSNKDIIVWPIPESKAFSNNYEEFNSNFSEYSLCKGGSDIYKLYRQSILENKDKIYIEANVLCDKIRIYHPQTKVHLDYIIYIDNYINDIHFHYYCQRVNNLESYTDNEFRINNNIYSEYVEFLIPNIEDLITNKEIFFKEDLNILTLNDSEHINDYKYLIDNVNISHNELIGYEQYIPIQHEDNFWNMYEPIWEDTRGAVTTYRNIETGVIYHQLWMCNDKAVTGLGNIWEHVSPCLHSVVLSDKFIELCNTDTDYEGLLDEVLKEDIVRLNYEHGVTYSTLENTNGWNPIHKEVILNTTKTDIIDTEDYVVPKLNYFEIGTFYTGTENTLASRLDSNNYKTTYSIVEENENLNTTMCSLYMLSIPFKITTGSPEETKKIFLPETTKTIENNYLTYPICITLFPYESIDNNGKYILHEEYSANSDIFMEELRFTLSSQLGFNHGILSIINKFNYPNKDKYPTFKEAYEFYNNVKFEDYSGIYDDDEDDIEQKQCSFEIIIASDVLFKQVIYNKYFESNEADDFAFNLNNIFNSWDNLPELLICKVRFVDKYLGTVIVSNNIIITKEWYKYLVNDLNKYRTFDLIQKQENWSSFDKITKEEDMDVSKFNFIDKINCIIKKDGESQTIYNVSSKPKVIMKPIFYRVQDLQNIKLMPGLLQNIGINLSGYMTKVDAFKLVIDGNTIIEYSRNDVFTIFKVDTTTFKNVSGKYHILNEEDEYISSGNWEIQQ